MKVDEALSVCGYKKFMPQPLGYRSLPRSEVTLAAKHAIDAMEAVCASERGVQEGNAPPTNIKALVDQEHRVRARSRARELAAIRHAPNNAARAFVQSEWRKHRDVYDNNKTVFAIHYVTQVRDKFVDADGHPLNIREKTIREVWLSDNTLSARNPSGLRADGE